MSNQACKQTITEYFAAIRAMDVDRFVNTFAVDGLTHDPVGTPPHVGHDAVRGFFSGLISGLSAVDLVEEGVFLCANSAAVRWHGSGTTKSGKAFTFEGVDVIDCNGEGKIILVRAFYDPAPIMAALQG